MISIILKTRYFDDRLFKTPAITPLVPQSQRNIKKSSKSKLHDLIKSRILVIRGFVAYAYNVNLTQWSRCSDLRRDRSYFSVSWIKGEIYALGTYSVIASGTAERFNPFTNIWQSIDPLPRKIRSFGVCTLKDVLYVTGGEDIFSDELSSHIYAYHIDFSKNERRKHGEWKVMPYQLPRPRYRHGSVAYHDKLWVLGGQYPDGSTTIDVHCWDPAKTEWSAAAPLQRKRYFCNALLVEDCIYAIGGDVDSEDNESSSFHSIEKLERDGKRWSMVTTFKTLRKGYSSCSNGDSKIFIFGGNFTGKCSMDVYDTKKDEWTTREMPYVPPNGQAISFPRMNLNWT